MSRFVELFERYGYNVEPFGESYIADNGVICIPFTEIKVGIYGSSVISAVSFLSCDKDDILKYYKDEVHIGCIIFSDWLTGCLKFTQFGKICNHDHSLNEIEAVLRC